MRDVCDDMSIWTMQGRVDLDVLVRAVINRKNDYFKYI